MKSVSDFLKTRRYTVCINSQALHSEIRIPKSKFLTEVREFIRPHGYSIRTEHTYIYWIQGVRVVDFMHFLSNPEVHGRSY